MNRATRRKETQRQQREAHPKLHPRGLARSVAKFINRYNHQTENEIDLWRENVVKLPKKGKARIHPVAR